MLPDHEAESINPFVYAESSYPEEYYDLMAALDEDYDDDYDDYDEESYAGYDYYDEWADYDPHEDS